MAAEETIARPGQPRRASRREEILAIAVELFATRGYHGVSMDDIGTAAGVTGPALYHHFAGKEAMLAAAIVPVSEGLLAAGRKRVENAANANAALAALIDFHVAFALDNPAVITLQLHELARLPEESRHTIRRLQRLYVEEWVGVLTRVRPGMSPSTARTAAHAAFGLMNSTPFLGSDLARSAVSQLLRRMTLDALLGGSRLN
jgi:AcrR family transcriptional regulator